LWWNQKLVQETCEDSGSACLAVTAGDANGTATMGGLLADAKEKPAGNDSGLMTG
jgi:hypothetical protein